MMDSNLFPTGDPNLTPNQINDAILPDEMVVNAVHRACDFFGIPEVPVINAHGACVWPNDTSTYDDDVFGFNREQLMSLGISGEDSLTLIYTHECAHRTLQGAYNDAWEEELACDYFAGIHAGIKGINIDNFEASLGATTGGDTHPNGALRADFIEYGKQVALEMQARGIELTYDGCLERLNQHILEKEGLITEYRERFDALNITEAISDNNSSHVSFKGLTQEEINNRKSKAEIEMNRQESNMRHHQRMIEIRTKSGLSSYTEQSHYRDAQAAYQKAKDDYYKWSNAHPDKN